jgi:hypothetical protein
MHDISTEGKPGRRPLLLLSLLLAGFAAAVLAEHAVFHRVPDMIQATYMIGALDIVDQGRSTPLVDLSPYGDGLSTRYYPPLLMHSLAWVFRVAGIAYPAVLWLTLPLSLLALVGVFVAGSAGGDRWNGLAAAGVLAAYPGFREASAGIYLDQGLACLIAVVLAALASPRGRAWLAGLAVFTAASTAAWLTRWTFALVPAVVVAVALGEAALGPRNGRRARIGRFAGLLGASVLAAMPFVFWLVTRADVGALAGNVTAEPTRIPWLSQLVFYPGLIATAGSGIPLALAALAALAHPAVWRSSRCRTALFLLLGGLAFLTWLPPKQPRYALMLYPSMALLTATAVRAWSRTGLRRGLGIALATAALATVCLDLARREPANPAFLEQLVDRIERDWKGSGTAQILVHDRYYRLEGDLNAPVLIFVNAVTDGGPKRFVEGLFEPGLVHGEGCWGTESSYDYVVLPVVEEHRHSMREDPFLSCLSLQRLAVVDLRSFHGESGEVSLYRVQ